MINESPVLILDESTSSLDIELYYEIERLILSVDDSTIISVTHRLDENILRGYDSIIIMKDGKIIDSGTFDILMDNNDEFRRLLSLKL